MVGFSEIDKYATKSYCAIHNVDESLNLGDITKIDLSNLPNADLITHGSPCTSFSLAGKGAGGDKGSDTPSSLMWYSVEIINRVKPKYVIWENVKNVLSKKHRHNFDLYIDTLDKMGYKSYFEVLNAKNYGVPQNRERIFVISILGEHKPFIFPDEIPLELKLKDILEESVEERYYLKDTKDFFIKNSFKMEYKGNGFRFAPHVKANANVGCTVTTRAGARMDDNFILDINSEQEKFEFSTKNFEIQANRLGGIFDTEGLSPTLDTMQEGGKASPCLTATQQGICYIDVDGGIGLDKNILSQLHIRKLTPKECWRLMSFTDLDIEKCISIGISNTQLYKQAGNSICVTILEGIFKNLLL
jgi:DNA (cytosine-5)-methyltransferase 1